MCYCERGLLDGFPSWAGAEVHDSSPLLNEEERGRKPMYYPPPNTPFPPGAPFPYYPPAGVRLGFWALRRLVRSLPPPQSYAEWQYQQALRTELRARRWLLFFTLIPR